MQIQTNTDSIGVASLIAGLEYVEKKSGQNSPEWLSAIRHRGADAFRQSGFPTPRDEAWKYTRLHALDKASFVTDIAQKSVRSFDDAIIPSLMLEEGQVQGRIVFINGVYQPEMSTGVEGLSVGSLAVFIDEMPELAEKYLGQQIANITSPMARLNDAYIQDGVVVYINQNAHVDKPIEILFLGQGKADQEIAFNPRNLIVVEDGAKLTLIERHIGQGWYFVNNATEIFVGDKAHLRHYRHQDESLDAVHVTTMSLKMGRDASYDGFTMTTGAKLSRNEIYVVLDGERSECHTNGVYLLGDSQHCDTTILMEHKQPHCRSNQNYKGVIDDKARGVFQGKIHVHRAAQKTDGYQLNNALLLSNQAEMDTKPELEIYADDVKCSHGATAGQLDEGPLFYLQSRGIGREQARAMLIEAFAGQALDDVDDKNVREFFRHKIAEWLRQGHL